MQELGQDGVDHINRQVAIISQDAFYRELSAEEAKKAQKGEFNFDHPGKPLKYIWIETES